MVGYRTIGFACSIVSSYNREISKDKVQPISNHVGTIKARDDFDLTLKYSDVGHSNYGAYYRYSFVDDNGNVLSWTSSKDQELEKGTKYLIRGTVKGHSEFKNVKRTEITRCEVVMIYGDNK